MTWRASRTIRLAVAIAVAVASGTAANEAHAKRKAPSEANAVVRDGIRYVAVNEGPGPVGRPGGYVRAWDVAAAKALWTHPVYRVRYDPKLEKDVQDVPITKLELAEGALLVRNEAGELYEMDLATGKVTVRDKRSSRTTPAADEEEER